MILCGLFCSGKSTIGKGVAHALALPFYEAGISNASELWRELGEKGFRDLETAGILSFKREACVIATGGGALMREENRAHLRKMGEMVYLKTPLSIIWERLQKRGMPAFLDRNNPKEHVEQIAKERLPIFEEFCDHVFETEGLSVEQCVIRLVKFFGSQRGESLTGERLASLSTGVLPD